MTALREYQRLEATGLWRATPDAQRMEVVVSIGESTLVITDLRDRALTHWSLPAVKRLNPGKRPVVYHPDGDPGETIELADSERQMIDAIEKLRGAIERRRPHPGRLRLAVLLTVLVAIALLVAFWLPGALRQHAVSVVPDVQRAEIGRALMSHIQRVTGPPCGEPDGRGALARLAARLPAASGPGRLAVMRQGVPDTVHLPGGAILIDRSLVEDHEEPDVVAGYIVAERLRADRSDPLARLLRHGGTRASFQLLTTGELSGAVLRNYAEELLTAQREPLSDARLLQEFEAYSVRSTPYAYAVDISGESTIGLIEADPYARTAPAPILSDADWLRLQGICEG